MKVEEIEYLGMDIVELLRRNADPYTEVCITQDGIQVKQIVESIPQKRD